MNDITMNISGKTLSIPFLTHFTHLVQVAESLTFGAAAHYHKIGLTYVDVPAIVGITGACENVDTLFKVGNRLDLPLFFTQTGQLALEQSLQSLHGTFTVIHSARDEEEEDERHLRQFRLTEEEFDATMVGMNRKKYDEEKMFDALLVHIQGAVQSMIRQILKDNKEVLERVYKRDTSKLQYAATHDFLSISYENAVKLLTTNGYPDIRFGDDLGAQQEATIVRLLNKKGAEVPVFITRYPKEIKFFNMKVSTNDPRVVLSCDLIFPHAGEGTGSAVREHEFEKLNERLITSTMYRLHLERGGSYEDFGWYLDIIKREGTQPHAGYGIGNERVLQYVFGETDIRRVSAFSLLNTQTGDWSKKRYGHAAIVTPPKRHILISIGKEKDKEYLRPFLKKFTGTGANTLYATERTYELLKGAGVLASRVYKISELGKSPNIADLMSKRVFDLIINIPTRDEVKEGKEFTDGKLIRKGAVDLGITLVTDTEVAAALITNLVGKSKDGRI